MTALRCEFASPIDAGRYGEFRSAPRERAMFRGRVGTPARAAEAGRYHLYGAWSSAASHRLIILRALAGLDDVVSLSNVDTLRDARGWAFRPVTGADPVNGFTLLRQAYERTVADYAGPVTVPVLWDRDADAIVSNEPIGIGVDLLTRFGSDRSLYLPQDMAAIDRAAATIAADVEQAMGRAVYLESAARTLLRTFAGLDDHLGRHSFLVGDRLTDADVRLWVLVARYDAGPNAHGAIGPRLDTFPNLWRWARGLYRRNAFARATDFDRFAVRPDVLPPWHETAPVVAAVA